MLDVSYKYHTLRSAVARATVTLSPGTVQLIRERKIPKGDPLDVARVAAIQAAKETSRIIPYCHPVPVDFVGVAFEVGADRIDVTVTVKAIYKTGVEMEALTGASVAALTLYDMMKMLDDTLEIVQVRLEKKKGGKGDFRDVFPHPPRAAVLVMSDSVAAGKKEDKSGKAIAARLEQEGMELADYRIVPDEPDRIAAQLIHYADEQRLDLVVTTGGTGFTPRDRTPEAMDRVIEREAPGIAEAVRAFGQARTPYSMLSRGRAGVRGRTLIVNLPGSHRGVLESLDALFPGLQHAFKMLAGHGHGEGNREQGAGNREEGTASGEPEAVAGVIHAISTSDTKGKPKSNVESATLIADWGIEGDAHAGRWHRQVSLLAIESIATMQAKGLDVGPGAFAENITTQGVPLDEAHIGDHIRIGGALLEVTQIGKACHNRCAIYEQAGDCIMPKEGIFARVLEGGGIRPGDPVTLLPGRRDIPRAPRQQRHAPCGPEGKEGGS